MADREIAMESRLGEAIATEAKALSDIEGVMDDRLEHEMLAAEAAERADVMRAEKDAALRIAHDNEEKVTVLSVTMVFVVVVVDADFEKGRTVSGCEAFCCCAGVISGSLLPLHCAASPVYIVVAELSFYRPYAIVVVDAVLWRAVASCFSDGLHYLFCSVLLLIR